MRDRIVLLGTGTCQLERDRMASSVLIECGGTRVVFGHWSALGLVVLPDYVCLDTGCIWGRQLTAVRLDKRIPRVIQVPGQQ